MSSKQILGKLIAFKTVSGGPTQHIDDFILAQLQGHATAIEIVPRPDAAQSNIIARFGPDTAGGVVLSGHTDVVPVDEQPWTVPPFEMTEKDAKLFGRGACDMKGFLACMLNAVPRLIAADLKRPIYLAFTCDEEPGCLGVPYLAKYMADQNIQLDAVVVGEPSMMEVIDQHKGAYVEEVTFHGVSAHSSMPWLGLSANEFAVEFSALLTQMGRQLLRQVDKGDLNSATTINLAQIRGGTAHNIVADKCTVMWSLRCPPGVAPDSVVAQVRALYAQLESKMKAQNSAANISFEVIFDVPPLSAQPGSTALALMLGLTGQNSGKSVNYGTEAGVYQRHGFASVICGPGSIEQAHKADEWVAISQLDACDAFIDQMIERQTS